MGNTRRAKPGRQSKTLSLRDENAYLKSMVKFQSDEIERLNGLISEPELERPADLEDWINEVALGEMSVDERAEWDAMSAEEKEHFVDALGAQLTKAGMITQLD